MKKIIQIFILPLVFLFVNNQYGVSQPTSSEVFQKGKYQTIKADYEFFVDSKIKNIYEGEFKLVVYEKNGFLYCVLYTNAEPVIAYDEKKVMSANHNHVLFFALKKKSGLSSCENDLDIKTYLSEGTSLNDVWRVFVRLKFCYNGKGYTISHKSWE